MIRQLSGKNSPIKLLETSFYGALAPFANWLTVSALSGISDDFDRYNDYKAAVKFVKDMGIEMFNRETDGEKGYGNAITIDLFAIQKLLTKARETLDNCVDHPPDVPSKLEDFSVWREAVQQLTSSLSHTF